MSRIFEKAVIFTVVLFFCASFALSPTPAFARGKEASGEAILQKSQVWSIPDPLSGRNYSASVSLPASYQANPQRLFPILYVTDADYGFQAIVQLMRRINQNSRVTEDFIVVGLSYANEEDPADSRLRDYTPVPRRDQRGGGAPAYQTYLHKTVFPFVESKLRADPKKRIYVGHSYGALLGVRILLTEPAMFSGYILVSPSLWYANHAIYDLEKTYAQENRDLPARVALYVGEFEAANPDDSRYNKKLDMVKDNADFAKMLNAQEYKSLQLHSEVIPAESHMTVFTPGFAKGIVDLLPAVP